MSSAAFFTSAFFFSFSDFIFSLSAFSAIFFSASFACTASIALRVGFATGFVLSDFGVVGVLSSSPFSSTNRACFCSLGISFTASFSLSCFCCFTGDDNGLLMGAEGRLRSSSIYALKPHAQHRQRIAVPPSGAWTCGSSSSFPFRFQLYHSRAGPLRSFQAWLHGLHSYSRNYTSHAQSHFSTDP